MHRSEELRRWHSLRRRAAKSCSYRFTATASLTAQIYANKCSRDTQMKCRNKIRLLGCRTPRPLWNLHCWQMFGTANSAASERINLCNMTRCTCREQEVRFILRNLLKVLHSLKLGRVSAVFSALWSLNELRFVANWPSGSFALRRSGGSRWP